MYSEKLESIPKKNLKDLETYLNEAHGEGVRYIRHQIAAREADISEHDSLVIISHLCNEGVLDARVRVYCPNCSDPHGKIYKRQSAVPSENKQCPCGTTFEMDDKSNWKVIYELPEEPVDFFLKVGERLRTFNEKSASLSSSFFKSAFEELSQIENKSKRGMDFDYFIGLLFHQIDGAIVEVSHEDNTNDYSGEVDVAVNFWNSPAKFNRAFGDVLLVENKWREKGADLPDMLKFEGKIQSYNKRNRIRSALFISVCGFKGTAEGKLNKNETPRVRGLVRSDVEQMANDGTAERVLLDKFVF